MNNRRAFLGSVAGVAATAVAATMGSAGEGATKASAPRAGGSRVLPPPVAVPGMIMPLALSAITTEGDRTATSIVNTKSFPEFVKLAKDCGYRGVHMRASLAGIQSPLEEIFEKAKILKTAGLKVASMSPDYATPINGPNAADCLRNIGPYLTFAEIFGCDLIRVGMKSEADIPYAQRAADEAAERKLRLVHHNEANTMFATVPLSVTTLRAIDRLNFGIIHDEAQLLANTKGYSDAQVIPGIKALAPWIWDVFCKNNRAWPGEGTGSPPEIPIDAKGGVNYDNVFDGLHAIGYKGWVSVHEKRTSYGDNADLAAKTCYDYLYAHIQRVSRSYRASSHRRTRCGGRV